MPVLDHPTHPSTIETSGARYGCFNRGLMKHGYYAKNGYAEYDHLQTVQQWDYQPHNLSIKCRSFGLWDTDPKCQGCLTDRDIEYAETMKGLR